MGFTIKQSIFVACSRLPIGCFHFIFAILAAFFFGVMSLNAQVNLALGKLVEASGPVWNGFSPALLTDGDLTSISHPLAGEDTLGFYYEVDLGAEFALDHIKLRNRSDGCCPERLSDFVVELLADEGGESGKVNWSARIHADGSNSGPSGVDIISRTNNAVGTFAGRFVRIVNNNGAGYSPQIAEVEVYGATVPKIHIFAADKEVLEAGESTTLRWEISGALSASISSGIGAVNATNGFTTVTPSGATNYTLTASNGAGTAKATVNLAVGIILTPPIITEFLADNRTSFKDAEGDTSDWIELYNPNDYRLSLQGYYLTDKPSQPQMWSFPDVSIPARGFLIVWASGKNKLIGGEAHTNFKLDDAGEYLGLFNKVPQLVQQFPLSAANPVPQQVRNVSYGLGRNAVTGFFRPPTPGATNGVAFEGVVADTKFSHYRGFYYTNISVTLSSTTPGTVIRYTTNKQEPTATSGLIYSGPIVITNTTVLRAAAFKPNFAPTDVDTHTYLFPSNIIAAANMRTTITQNPIYKNRIREGLVEIPSVSIVSPATINGSAQVKASVEWIGPNGDEGFQEDAGVRNFGGAFTDFAKKNFRLYFKSEYGTPKLEFPIFEGFDLGTQPANSFNQLELRGGSHDMVDRGFYMANIFTDDTMLEMGQLNPHGRFVHLYLNGTYWGLYHLRERWDAAMHESYLGGARENYESINGNWNVGGWAEPGTAYDGDGSTWSAIKAQRDKFLQVREILDVPHYIDYMLMWMFGGSEDEYRATGPKVDGSGFKFFLNDADGWFCGPWYCAAGDRTVRGAPGRSAGDGPGSVFSMLFQEGHPDYKVLLADRIYQALFRDGALTPAQTTARLARRSAEVEDAFLAEAARWNYLSPVEWESRRNHSLNTWLPSRPQEFLTQLRNAGFYPRTDVPQLDQQGGIVAEGFQPVFTGPNQGSIYFTVDGTDPRLPGGQPSPQSTKITMGGAGEILVPAESRWKWFTDATGLGSSSIVTNHVQWSASNWKHLLYIDNSWPEGPAQLGYGENDEATVIPFGPDAQRKWPTAYFRKKFSINKISDVVEVRIRLKRDDGAIVYLNGNEVVRTAITSGPVEYSTYSEPASDDGASFNEFIVPVKVLQVGQNQLAIELHQSTATSTDASFDLELSIVRRSGSGEPGAFPVITANTVIKARTLNGTEWSALNTAFFQVGPLAIAQGDLTISELHYDAGRNGHEFLELLNTSQKAVNLRGAKFVDGIQYSFGTNRDVVLAPNQRLLLAADLYRFQQRYGNDLPTVHLYNQALSAQADRLVMLNASNEPILSLQYSTNSPWMGAIASGSSLGTNSYSMVLAYPALGMNNPLAWRWSADSGGAPGLDDAFHFTGTANADADGDGLNAFVEYAVGTSDSEPGILPLISTQYHSNGKFTVTFTRRLAADDAAWIIETSSDLETWSPAQLVSSRHLGNGFSEETWSTSTFGVTAQFLRRRLMHLQ